jgi:hypothetical protein
MYPEKGVDSILRYKSAKQQGKVYNPDAGAPEEFCPSKGAAPTNS